MPVSFRKLRDRVASRLHDLANREPSYSPLEYDEALATNYLYLATRVPAPVLVTANAVTIAAGASTFTLPVTTTSYSSSAEYAGEIRLQLASNLIFLRKRTPEEMDALRSGQGANILAVPYVWAVYEDGSQVVQGRCYPGSKAADTCHLYASMAPNDLRDYVGSGSDNLDGATVLFSRIAAEALLIYTAADLLLRMPAKLAESRGLNQASVPMDLRKVDEMLYAETVRRNQLESVGRVQRWVS